MELTDVTVREAAQMPGRSYTVEERVAAGEAIDRLGVARIQTGFPAAGAVDREVTATLSGRADADTVAIARALSRDVDAAVEADADVVEVFAPVSELHLKHELGKSRETVLGMLEEAVARARDGGATVRVAVLDAFRSELDHVARVFKRFPDVSRVGLADTVGRRSPATVTPFLSALETEYGVDLERAGVHFHDDLGVGVANVQAAYRAGVGNADVSVTALGERVGNPATEEVVALGDLEHDDPFGADPTELVPVTEAVVEALDEPVPERKPVVGTAATTHEAGLHTAVMLDAPEAYEPFDPARFGGQRTLVFGEGTGRRGAIGILERAGVDDPDEAAVEAFLSLLAEQGPLDQTEATALARREFA